RERLSAPVKLSKEIGLPNAHTLTLWNQTLKGGVMVVLMKKLHRLKQELKTWNRLVYGNIDSNVKKAQEELMNLWTHK
ncbi:hypothetical protein IFM89_025457, partial [Coptis chinensis]